MQGTEVASIYQNALPVLGVNGSLATSGVDLPAKGHVYAKTGTTIAPGQRGDTIELKAQNLAGYIETKSGRLVAYALMVNNAGPVEDIETDVSAVITDEARISNIIYESL
jgi:D-alanyl-D-alanine carboxypeptidase/D-alanyl-D-alanine-endopeptidase (penicillin-binding protein 4)